MCQQQILPFRVHCSLACFHYIFFLSCVLSLYYFYNNNKNKEKAFVRGKILMKKYKVPHGMKPDNAGRPKGSSYVCVRAMLMI